MIEQVSGKIAFHVNRQLSYSLHPQMQVGEKLLFGEDYNPFFEFYNKPLMYPVAGIGEVAGLRLLQHIRSGVVAATPKLPVIAEDLMRRQINFSRELLAELVRASEFTDAPSRMKCLWIVESLAEARSWEQRLRPHPEWQIAELRLDGTIATCDAGWLLSDTNNAVSDSLEEARRYWRGEFCPSDPQPEILFTGEATVVSVTS